MNLILINIYLYNWCKINYDSHHLPKYVFLTLNVFFKSSVTVHVTLSMLRHCPDFEGNNSRRS